MLFVSYAQNFEDVMLWRALSHVERGFYIDVGAQSADLDSVTRAFSERGWRGINIEPHPLYFAQLSERRPLDINLCTAVGDRTGALTMNFVEVTGLSTADDGIAAGHAAAGYVLNRAEVSLTTLAALWKEHVPPQQAVHFLKVDVEGFEAAVLAGNDWACHRPWIVVVEATLPNSRTESHAEWEGTLLNGGYEHVYSDGLNRFYVAQEHAELGNAFKYPPNVFDGFVTADLEASRHRLSMVEAELSEIRARIAFTETTLIESQRRIELAEASAIEARTRERQARLQGNAEASELRALIVEANHRAEEVARHYREVLSSSSWRITAPLRKVASAVPRSVWRHARRAAKAAWWIATPWRLPARLRFLRERNGVTLQAESVKRSGNPPMLDLTTDQGLLQACGLSRDEVLWPVQSGQAIVDTWSAARFCIDMLRARADVRTRFPRALSEPERSGFAQWLTDDHGNPLDLSERAKKELRELLHQDVAAPARQMFLFRADVRAGLPHGLTPPGQAELFRWFMREGRSERGLRSEEILWLFMQAAENPALELVRAFLFTPEWQKLYPDGLTVFGRRAFSEWFAASYQAAPANWLEPSTWPVDISVSRQLREAYYAREDWQRRQPGAFDSVSTAMSLLVWLQSGEVALTEEAQAWCAALDVRKVAEELASLGVNMIGHFCCPSGVRVSAEALAEGMKELGIQTSLRDLRTDVKDEPNHVRFQGLEDFDATIIHTQPEPFFSEAYARSDLQERSPRTYRIAFWYWEFDSVPESWIGHASGVDEVWAATEFVAKGLRERLSVPVKTLFPGVQLGTYTRRDRKYFGIPDNTFTFLFNFHMNSVMERKNPLGLIRAFKQAFRPDESVSLVVKTMFGHHHPAQMDALLKAAADCNVQVIDQTYDADEVLSLTDVCDAYVSLHRSEGLGLTMAEAMLMGKPVIATNYSGNVDFMNDSNSLLVPYELVKLGRALPPYDADLMWAEPSIEHAAALMRRVFDEPAWARELGARAKASAEASLSVHVAGRKVAQRLAEIKAQRVTVIQA
ncbi:methyltransferase, FkbM family [Variovorax sp. CF079]|uniref:FkbM family methyltransferase n=1 Tax=Variovorax sp. CF079 TaxID=1882774 RepID=UPI000885290F|nr:FkbM family methyltransferase [Variovorax sp. CF079]SDD67372.1 methyltransferase, FkbM family [Variovorax sp. CF079]